MHRLSMIKFFALATPILASALLPGISLAGPSDGVKCPNGFTASFNNGVLKCSKKVPGNPEFRKSVCPLILGVGMTYHRKSDAADYCTRNDNGAKVPTVPENAFDPENYTREVDGGPGAQDRFRKGGYTQVQFVYPNQL